MISGRQFARNRILKTERIGGKPALPLAMADFTARFGFRSNANIEGSPAW